MSVLANLDPQKVFYYFEEISNIPRGSGNEKAISDYMVRFAEEKGLWVKQDEAYNIYIKKPATKGYEQAPTVILQGHMDMVCEKNNDTVHDFEKEGLKLAIDGDFIYAKGTTLGADNGVAIAYQLAILADDTLEHPALEILMTTEEETGMDGVSSMHPAYLEGKRLINLDTDNEGEFLVSCAGGSKARITLPLAYSQQPQGTQMYAITISGLVGGHSGADIHLERASANQLMNRLLDGIMQEVPYQLAKLSGGTKDNVITREASALICIPQGSENKVSACLAAYEATFKQEYEAQDKGITIHGSIETETAQVVCLETTQQIIGLVMMLPQGVIAQSMQIPGLVETSLNIGVVQMTADVCEIVLSIRSSLPSKKEFVKRKIVAACEAIGATYELTGDYPAWTYVSESPLRDQAVRVFETMYGKQPTINAIHAGLECGFLLEKMPGLDMIAFGPNVYEIHSPKERVSIASMGRVYHYLTALLKALK